MRNIKNILVGVVGGTEKNKLIIYIYIYMIYVELIGFTGFVAVIIN